MPDRFGAIAALTDAIKKSDMKVLSVRGREHLMRPTQYRDALREAKDEGRRTIKAARAALDEAIQQERAQSQRISAPSADEAARLTLYATRGMALAQAGMAGLARAVRTELVSGNRAAAREYLNVGGDRLSEHMGSLEYAKARAAATPKAEAKAISHRVGLDRYTQELGWLDKYVDQAISELGAGDLDAVDRPTRGDANAALVSKWQERAEGAAVEAALSNAQSFTDAAASAGVPN